jgi:NADH-quinone oxidoreductase subunit J
VLAQLGAILVWGGAGTPVDPHTMQNTDLAVNNVERIGMLLYTDYLVPFEVASILLLVAMVGAIILAKREL